MRILVTGGNGFLGRATVAALTAAGHSVRAIVRDADGLPEALSRADVDIVVGDPGDPAAIAAATDGVDAVVHMAATFAYDRTDGSAMSPNVPLARTVLSAAGDAGIARVLDVSSLIVFSLAADRIDRSTPLTRPDEPGWTDPYLRSKVEAETVGRELEAAGLPRVTLYPGTVIGPDDRVPGPSGRLLSVILRGISVPDARAPWVDVRDVARAVVLALDAPAGARFNLTSGVASHRETAALMDELTGRAPRRIFMSPSMVRGAARFNDLAAGRLAPLPKSGQLDFMLSSARWVDVSHTERALGLTFRPLRETLADTIRWWAANGTIPPKVAGRLAPSG